MKVNYSVLSPFKASNIHSVSKIYNTEQNCLQAHQLERFY